MEDIDGVDVSWLHHSHKDHQHQRDTAESRNNDSKMDSTEHDRPPAVPEKHNEKGDNAMPIPNSDTNPHQHHHSHRPHIHIRSSPESPNTLSSPPTPKSAKDKQSPPSLIRRGSWISNLSSKFSSSAPQSPSTLVPLPGKLSSSPANEPTGPSPMSSPIPKETKKHDSIAQSPSSPRSSGPSFLQSALRRLSSTGAGGLGKISGNGGVCPRRTYNVDIHRDRCQVEDLQPAKLRRVAFCVDVEIASAAKYSEDDEDGTPEQPVPARRPSLTELERQVAHNKAKEQKQKSKDKAEAEALKHPEAVIAAKEEENDKRPTEDKLTETSNPAVERIPNGEQMTRKKEKKKKSEEERKERKEKKRLAAVANGTIPIEIKRESSSSGSSTTGNSSPRTQDRPTTDPLRIYRRCCQLRETPVLKRITEQLGSPSVCHPSQNGTIMCLDLTSSRMQLSDMVTLGDYLAVVPVKKIILEDCGLSDEGLRVILAGLLAVKTTAQARFNKDLTKRLNKDQTSDERVEETEHLGVVEKISLKNNPKIGRDGWRHIALFIHMSRSLKAIDLSMIPFPSKGSNQSLHGNQLKPRTVKKLPADLCLTFEKCLVGRLAGSRLEELVMGECGLSTEHISKIVRGVIGCGATRLGLANNNLTVEAMEDIAYYVETGKCEGLDLGGNNLSNGRLDVLVKAIESNGDASHNLLHALSLADCKLSTPDIKLLLPVLAKLPNFRFIDLSHNRSLFSTQPNAIAVLRKYLPRMSALKRVHLNDVAMESEHCIALAEILPEVPNLAHLSLLENESLMKLASASDEASQEEACALYASCMAAVRVSDSIVCIDIDVPTQDSGEMVQALAKQVVAYSLRNMERGPLAEAYTGAGNAVHDLDKVVQVPDILLHLVGHVDGFPENHDDDEPAPDADYIVGGTGVVKALSVCLGNKAADYRRPSRDSTPAPSGTATPKQDAENVQGAKGKAMSKNLLGSARKIRARLQPALVREAKQGDDMAYRRLQFLDSTLERIIQRFEDEYPECRLVRQQSSSEAESPGEANSESSSLQSSAPFHNPFSNGTKPETVEDSLEIPDDDDSRPNRISLSRHDSDVSVASKHLTIEEGRMHRFGQQVRRDILRPQAAQDFGVVGSGDGDEEEADHVQLLRQKLEALSGREIKEMVKEHGSDELLKRLGATAEELPRLKVEDPREFEKFREAQAHARRNVGKGGEEGEGDGEVVV